MRNVSVNSIGGYIREQREQAKISMRQLAQAAGVSNPYLSQIERGLRKPSADILQQIAKGLRISAEALYVQAGILEDKPADSGVRSALLADPHLAERQKQVLIEIYESFRRENAAAAESQLAAAEAGEQAADQQATAEDGWRAAVEADQVPQASQVPQADQVPQAQASQEAAAPATAAEAAPAAAAPAAAAETAATSYEATGQETAPRARQDDVPPREVVLCEHRSARPNSAPD